MTYFGNHFGTGARRNALAAVLLSALTIAVAISPSARAAGLYTVAKVSVDVKAKDAVAAKQTALAQAKQRALRTVFKRLAPYSAYDRLPAVKADLIEDMLENFLVRRERNSATQYLATLDFEFNADAVRQLLTGYDIPWSDVRGAPVTVLPVFIADGKVDASGQDPWRRAWLELDLEHAVTPVKLVRHGPSVTAETIASILAGDAGGFEALKDKYKSDNLVLAVAETKAGEPRVSVKLYGLDAAGPIALARDDRIFAKDLGDAARRAAAVTLGILEGRWKVTQTISESTGSDASRHAIVLTVEFGSLKQWQEIRARLTKIPGVQALKVGSLSARSADVSLRFPGGTQSLAAKLPAYNMALLNLGGVLVLRSN